MARVTAVESILRFKDLHPGDIFRSAHPCYSEWWIKTDKGSRVQLSTGRFLSGEHGEGNEDHVLLLPKKDHIVLQNGKD